MQFNGNVCVTDTGASNAPRETGITQEKLKLELRIKNVC